MRGQGEGLIQNGIIFGNTILPPRSTPRCRPNGYYSLRLATFQTDASADQPQDARQVLQTAVTTDDPTLSWTTLITDVKTLDWKFQDFDLGQWSEHVEQREHPQPG
ncbi:MAG: hypothetical protein WDO13_12610 [Verrucomicrobiota bacterium]